MILPQNYSLKRSTQSKLKAHLHLMFIQEFSTIVFRNLEIARINLKCLKS